MASRPLGSLCRLRVRGFDCAAATAPRALHPGAGPALAGHNQLRAAGSARASLRGSIRAWSSQARSSKGEETYRRRPQYEDEDAYDDDEPKPPGLARRVFWLALKATIVGGLALGAGVGSYVGYREIKDFSAQAKGMLAKPAQWEIDALSLLPLRLGGAIWGRLASTEVLPSVRPSLYRGFATLFGADLSEIGVPLESFATLNDFYARPLRDGARPVAPEELVSPVDGQIMHFGPALNDEELEQVKGLTYQRSALFGGSLAESIEMLRAREAGDLPWYSVSIFMGPGDYHRVHAPADFEISKSRHFPGYLFPLHPFFSRYIPHIFAMNERLVAMGRWKHGGIAMAAVGSLDVGHITATFDPTIRVKKLGDLLPEYPPPPYGGPVHERRYRPALKAARGEELIVFHMGSTVVLVFQAPRDFKFDPALAPGRRVRCGQALGTS